MNCQRISNRRDQRTTSCLGSQTVAVENAVEIAVVFSTHFVVEQIRNHSPKRQRKNSIPEVWEFSIVCKELCNEILTVPVHSTGDLTT